MITNIPHTYSNGEPNRTKPINGGTKPLAISRIKVNRPSLSPTERMTLVVPAFLLPTFLMSTLLILAKIIAGEIFPIKYERIANTNNIMTINASNRTVSKFKKFT